MAGKTLSTQDRKEILDALVKHPLITQWTDPKQGGSKYELDALFPHGYGQSPASAMIAAITNEDVYQDETKFKKAVANFIHRSDVVSGIGGEPAAQAKLKADLDRLIAQPSGQRTAFVEPAKPAAAQVFAGASVTGGAQAQEAVNQNATAAGRNKQAPFGPMSVDLGIITEDELKQRVGIPYNQAYVDQFRKLPAVNAALTATNANAKFSQQTVDALNAAIKTGDKLDGKISDMIKSVQDEPTRTAIQAQYDQFTSQAGFKVDERTTLVKPVIGAYNGNLDGLLNEKLGAQNPDSKDTSKSVRNFVGTTQASGWLEAFGKEGKSELGTRVGQGLPNAWGDMTRGQKLAHAAGVVEALGKDNKNPEVQTSVEAARRSAAELAIIHKIEQQAEAQQKGGVYAEAGKRLASELTAEGKSNARVGELQGLRDKNPDMFATVKADAERSLAKQADNVLSKSWGPGKNLEKYTYVVEAVNKELRGDAGDQGKAVPPQEAKPAAIDYAAGLSDKVKQIDPYQVKAQKTKGGLDPETYVKMGFVGKGTKGISDDDRYLRNNLIALGVVKADEKGALIGAKEGQSLNDALTDYVKGSHYEGKAATAAELLDQTKRDMLTTQVLLGEKDRKQLGKFGADGVAGSLTMKGIQAEQDGMFKEKTALQQSREIQAEAVKSGSEPKPQQQPQQKQLPFYSFDPANSDRAATGEELELVRNYLISRGYAKDENGTLKNTDKKAANSELSGVKAGLAELNVAGRPGGSKDGAATQEPDDQIGHHDIAAIGAKLEGQGVKGSLKDDKGNYKPKEVLLEWAQANNGDKEPPPAAAQAAIDPKAKDAQQR